MKNQPSQSPSKRKASTNSQMPDSKKQKPTELTPEEQQLRYENHLALYKRLWDEFKTDVYNLAEVSEIRYPYPCTLATCKKIKEAFAIRENGKVIGLNRSDRFSDDAKFIHVLEDGPQGDYTLTTSPVTTALKGLWAKYQREAGSWVDSFEVEHAEVLEKKRQEAIEKKLQQEAADLQAKQLEQEKANKAAEEKKAILLERQNLQETLKTVTETLLSSQKNQQVLEGKISEVMKQNSEVIKQNQVLSQQVTEATKEIQFLRAENDRLSRMGTPVATPKEGQTGFTFANKHEKTAAMRLGGAKEAIRIQGLAKECQEKNDVKPLLAVLFSAIGKFSADKREGICGEIGELFSETAMYFPQMPAVVLALEEKKKSLKVTQPLQKKTLDL